MPTGEAPLLLRGQRALGALTRVDFHLWNPALESGDWQVEVTCDRDMRSVSLTSCTACAFYSAVNLYLGLLGRSGLVGSVHQIGGRSGARQDWQCPLLRATPQIAFQTLARLSP